MHHWWCNCRKSPGFTPSCRQGEGKGAGSSFRLLSAIRDVQSKQQHWIRSHQPAQGTGKLCSPGAILAPIPACLGREGEQQHHPSSAQWITVCGSKPSSPRGGFTLHVAAAGSLIKATSAAGCISLAVLPIPPVLVLCTTLLYQSLECRSRADPTPGTGPQSSCRLGLLLPLAWEGLSSLRPPMSQLPPGVVPVL